MTDKPGFNAFEKRIEELIETTGDIAPADMMMLLKRADANPRFSIEKELKKLRKKNSLPQSD